MLFQTFGEAFNLLFYEKLLRGVQAPLRGEAKQAHSRHLEGFLNRANQPGNHF
jgi:hypothetical protein